jgi:DNA-binding Xre family transcriptional regulator
MVKLSKNKVLARMYMRDIPTKRELAARVGLSERGLYALLRGEHGLNADTLITLSRVLDCPVEEIISVEESE